MRVNQKKTVLFLCTGNSARSQMAEALLLHKASDKFDVVSAGTHPEKIDERAIQALSQFGLNTDKLTSTHINELEGQAFDYVITLCDKANTECRSYPNTAKQLAWDFPDPKSRLGNNPFLVTLHELNNRLSMFLMVEDKADAKTTESQFKLAPTDFYKTLTDSIRLKTLMLTHYHGELCVCELMEALEENSQPKVSRNLAVLKKTQVITDRKHGQWVFYRINPELPLWAKLVIAQTTESNVDLIQSELKRLDQMKNRPNKTSFCQ